MPLPELKLTVPSLQRVYAAVAFGIAIRLDKTNENAIATILFRGDIFISETVYPVAHVYKAMTVQITKDLLL